MAAPAGWGKIPREVSYIHPLTLPRDIDETLQRLAFATGVGVEEHVRRAVRGYLEDEGHLAAVRGSGERAHARPPGAFHRLA